MHVEEYVSGCLPQLSDIFFFDVTHKLVVVSSPGLAPNGMHVTDIMT